MKSLVPHPLDKQKPYLMTLRKIVRELGGSTKCHFQPLRRPEIHMSEHVAEEVGIQLLQKEKDGTLPLIYLLLEQSMVGSSRMYSTNPWWVIQS